MFSTDIKRYQKAVYFTILSIAVVWCSGIIAAPLLHNWGRLGHSVSDFLYTFFSSSCHQQDERSLHLAGLKLGVCSRCTFIYFTFLFGTLLYPFIKKLNDLELPPLWLLFIPVALIGLDVVLDLTEFYRNSFISREITGALLGLILPFFIIPGATRVFYEFFIPSKIIPSDKKNN